MARRSRMSRKANKKSFRKGLRTSKRNTPSTNTRGGIRL